MGPPELIATEACFIGTRAELSASDINSDHACRVPKYYPQQKLVFPRPTEACDFERHAAQRGCSFHSLELTVWSKLCHAPSARHAALAWKNVLL
jgi:hypothetical protein